MEQINIQFSLFSAFYTPLISAISGGFLEAEGLRPDWSVAPPSVSAIESLENGSAHVVQSALSQGFNALAKGKTLTTSHFAQINEMDGFFLTGREADPEFSWQKLEGSEVVLFGGGQPLAMFKYACYKAGIEYDKIKAIHVGGAADMDAAFRAGQGQYIQQQGPYPQQLETDGVGHIVAQVGKQIGLCGFSSLAATKDWLQGDMAQAFMRGYRKARLYINEASAAEIARAQKSFFPEIDELALADCLATYKNLGCWTPHVEITQQAFEATQDIFEYNGSLKKRYVYEEICSRPPKGS
ncbi:MAG: ABC transporter substrate-binding protein [Proteobacteria bacterium]|nr:ABC transporter substrate-binding protein [Pseudomonadota bacterium]